MTSIRTLVVALAMLSVVSGVRAESGDTRIPLARPLTFVDAGGRPVSTADFPGKWLLLYFGYTHCADQCPTALTAMVTALDEIGPAAEKIQPLFISVDPERDRGAALQAFTAAFDPRLVGLTGTPEQIATAAKTLGIQYEKVLAGSDDYVIDHSATLSLIGPESSNSLGRREALTFAMAEPHLIAAKLLEQLQIAGVALGNVNNLRAYR